MEVLKLTNKNFEEEILNGEITAIVDFYAEWCGPCKMMSPIIDEIATENPNIKVAKINVDENEELAAKYNIMSIPTIIIFKNGEIKDKFVGVTGKETILNTLK